MKVLLLVNSSASSVTGRAKVLIRRALSERHEVTLAETSRRGHATRLARGAAADGIDLVVVLGGDGTLNEAANGLVRTDCAMAALPGGSTNVFARTLGIPDDPVEATTVVLDAVDAGRIRRVGLGRVNGRYFLFHCGLGFDAAVVEQVEKRSGLKRYAGHPLFIWAGLATWLRHYDRRRPHMRVLRPDGSDTGDLYLAIVQNTDPYTYLGSRPLSLAPEATFDRGLTCVGLRSMSLRPMLSVVWSLIRGDTGIRDHPMVSYDTDLSCLDVVGLGPFPYQVDGDLVGDTEKLAFSWDPECLDLVVPGPGI